MHQSEGVTTLSAVDYKREIDCVFKEMRKRSIVSASFRVCVAIYEYTPSKHKLRACLLSIYMPYILKGYIYIWYSTCTHTVYAHEKTGCAFFYAGDCMYSMSVLCIYACMYLYILSLSVVFFKYNKMSNQIEIIIFIDFSICFQLIEVMMNINVLQL